MIDYRFPILFTLCLSCLGTMPNNARALTTLEANISVSAADPIAQASPKAVPSALSVNSPNSAYNRSMQAGYAAVQKRDYTTALTQFKKALEERPQDIYAQQAMQNVEAYLARDKGFSQVFSDNPWWFPFALAAIAVGFGGTLAFFFWALSRKPRQVEQQELDPVEPELFEAIPYRASENVQNGQVDANAFTSQETDGAFPIQPTTRLAQLDQIEDLINDLHKSDPKQRRKAIWELAQKSDSRAMKPLVDLMIDTDSQERSLILEALSQISTRTLKPMNQALAISLQDKNPQVRKNAIRDLTRIYDLMSQISQLLCHAIDDGDTEVQETAKWALNQLNLQMPPRFDFRARRQDDANPRETSYSESLDI